MTNEQLGPSLAMCVDPIAALALASRHAAQIAKDEAAEEARTLCGRLSDAERHALVLACKGMTAKSAAALHGGSFHTMYTHRCRALQKMGVNSIAEAAVLAAKAGLV